MTAAAPGSIIKILPGTYPAVTVSISGDSGRWIKFEAQAGGIVTIGGGTNSFTINGSYLWFYGITIPQSTTHGFLINSANFIFIDHCTFADIASANNRQRNG